MERGNERDDAPALDYPNHVKPESYNNIHHTNMRMPRPRNHEAMRVNPEEVMSHVLKAK